MMEIKYRFPKKRQYRIPIYQIKVTGFPVESPQLLDRIKDSPSFPKKPCSYQFTNRTGISNLRTVFMFK